MKCKGIVAIAKGDAQMIDVDVMDPGPHEIQIRMASTLISPGTERAWVIGLPNSETDYPYVPGYCCAGWVEKLGEGVTGFEVGDRVACYAVNVGHREIGNVPDYRVVHVPDSVSFEHAAFTSLGQTSLQGVRKCKIQLGESMVSLGLGIVGMFALQFAHLNGALPAIGVDRIEKRLDIALKCGADYVFNNQDGNLKSLLKPVTKGKGPAIVIDNTGVPAAMTEVCDIAANYARVCILGCPRGITDFNFYSKVQKKSITIIGAHAVDSIPVQTSYPNYWTFADDAYCFLDFVKKGDIKIDPMITDCVSWKDAEQVYQRVISWDKDAIGIVINWPSYK